MSGILTEEISALVKEVVSDGFVSAAIDFEKMKDIRAALTCIYRNVRYRARDKEWSQLDNDIREFNVDEAGIDTMLAMLTATAPYKSSLPSRKKLYQRIHSVLKKTGLLQNETLDGLK